MSVTVATPDTAGGVSETAYTPGPTGRSGPNVPLSTATLTLEMSSGTPSGPTATRCRSTGVTPSATTGETGHRAAPPDAGTGGGSDAHRRAGFAGALRALGLREGSGTAPAAIGLAELDAALDALDALAPPLKRRLLAACASVIASDGQVSEIEAEIFRAISDTLGCPVPPLLPGQPLHRARRPRTPRTPGQGRRRPILTANDHNRCRRSGTTASPTAPAQARADLNVGAPWECSSARSGIPKGERDDHQQVDAAAGRPGT